MSAFIPAIKSECGHFEACIGFNRDLGEYKVRFYCDGSKIKKASYFTDNKADAVGTARLQIAQLCESATPVKSDFDLLITFNGNDMGTTPVSYDGTAWDLCDACYALFDAVGEAQYGRVMTAIFCDLAAGMRNGTIDGAKWFVTESLS